MRPELREQLVRRPRRDQRDDAPHEYRDGRIKERDHQPGGEQSGEQALRLAGEMPEKRDEAGRRRRLLGWIGGLQQPLEARKHGTDSGNGWRARGDAWRRRALVAVIGCGRVEELRVGTMMFGCCRLRESADLISARRGDDNQRPKGRRAPRVWLSECHLAGVRRRIRPELLSVASHSAPSGPSRTSRIRSRSCCRRRSSATTLSPSTPSRTKSWPASAPTNRLPRQGANTLPL